MLKIFELAAKEVQLPIFENISGKKPKFFTNNYLFLTLTHTESLIWLAKIAFKIQWKFSETTTNKELFSLFDYKFFKTLGPFLHRKGAFDIKIDGYEFLLTGTLLN